MNEKPYTITIIDNMYKYVQYQKKTGYREEIQEFTESGYPKIFAMGWTSHVRREIIILKMGNWQRRLMHEVGHEVGLKHVDDVKNIMYPYCTRGTEGIHSIDAKYYLKYGNEVYIKLLELTRGL